MVCFALNELKDLPRDIPRILCSRIDWAAVLPTTGFIEFEDGSNTSMVRLKGTLPVVPSWAGDRSNTSMVRLKERLSVSPSGCANPF